MSPPDLPSPSHWEEVQRLFHAAREQPSAARAAWLTDAARGDGRLRREVAALLAADDAPNSQLDRPLVDLFGPPAAVIESDVAPAVAPAGPLATGAVVGPYEIVRLLGRGGMGVVYLTRDTRTGDSVALKVLRPLVAEVLAPVEARRRFLREIRVGAGLTHPGLVPVLESGESAGRLWFSMPFVEGETLRARSKREGPLPVRAVAHVGRQLAEALAWLAERGIVHRDVKPDNVLLSAEGDGAADGASRAQLADFGVARSLTLADVDGRLTATGVVLGTLRYMSPEQIRGAPVDAAADVFALGALLHEVLAGELPFRGATQRALLAPGPAATAAPDLRRARADVPDAMADAIRAALAADPRDRPTAAAVAHALA